MIGIASGRCRHFLRLPTSLRNHALAATNPAWTTLPANTHARWKSFKPRKQTKHPVKAGHTGDPKQSPSLQSEPPPKPTRITHAKSEPQRTSGPHHPQQSIVKPETSPEIATSGPAREAKKFIETAPEVRLYRAPRHGSFRLFAYTCGSTLGAGSLLTISNGLAAFGSADYLTQGLVWLNAVGLAAVASTLLVAPTGMIRSISIIRAPGVKGGALLRLRTESRLGLTRWDKTIDAGPEGIAMNRPLAATRIRYTSIARTDVKEFTKSDHPLALPPAGLTAHVRRSLQNLLKNVGRAFVRSGMVYVEIPGHGVWKLDVEGAEILMQGEALTAMTTLKPVIERGAGLSRLIRLISGKSA